MSIGSVTQQKKCVLWPEVFFFWERGSLYLNSLELEGPEAQNPQCVTVSDGEQDYHFHPLGPRFMYSAY